MDSELANRIDTLENTFVEGKISQEEFVKEYEKNCNLKIDEEYLSFVVFMKYRHDTGDYMTRI